jgi:hypothetical protein
VRRITGLPQGKYGLPVRLRPQKELLVCDMVYLLTISMYKIDPMQHRYLCTGRAQQLW